MILDKIIKETFIISLLICSFVVAQDFIKIENHAKSLYESMQTAFEKGKSGNDFWIGYNIVKQEVNNITIGSFYTDDYMGISLRDLIKNTGFKNITHKKNNAGRNIRIINGRRIGAELADREVAILFKYDRNSTGLNDFAEINVCNLSSYIDLGNYKVFWLGKSDGKESVSTLINIYNSSKSSFAKEELIAPIGIHSDEPGVIEFLKDVYSSKESDDLREEAVFWIGFQNNLTVLELLKKIIREDQSADIREKAVMAIGQLKYEEATDELIKIAKTNPESEIREEAIMWLGQQAVRKAELALKDFVENDPDIEIKKRALYALANNPEENVPYLIELANSNKSLQIRKHAIWALGNSDDKRALEALIKLAKK